MSGEALDAIFGIYVKNVAQRCVRELCRCSVALFPGSVAIWGLLGPLGAIGTLNSPEPS